MLPTLQSAYRANHSTETAVLKTLADILTALDSGDLAVLTLLVLSAAFDSIDHSMLLRRLQTTYGLNGCVINWFTSYLSSWLQHVRISTTSSTSSAVPFGVPEGSVLRPILFLLYTADLLQLISHHLLHPHAIAYDTQIYGFCKPSTTDILCQSLSACINDASMWLKSNRLLLNPAMTEVLWCSSPRHRNIIPTQPLSIGNTSVLPVLAVRDLGIYVDAHVTMKNHVTVTVSFMLRCVVADSQCSSISFSTRLADPDSPPCDHQGRLLHFCTRRHHWSPNEQVTVRSECRCSVGLLSQEIRAHNSYI